MADNKKIDIDVIVNSANAAKSVGDLRKALKELTFAQEEVDKSSPDFENLTNAINEVEGKIGDLGDAFKTFTGSGVERLNASTGLLSESLNSLDLGKLQIGLQGLKALPKALANDVSGLSKTLSFANLNFKTIGSSMKGLASSGVGELTKSIIQLGKAILTNPILLLAAVIIGIVAAIVKFYDKIKPVKAIVEAIGEAIGWVIDKLKEFSDWLGLTSFEAEEAAKKQEESAKKAEKAISQRYDREIAIASAAGKETEELELAKTIAVKKSVQDQINALNDLKEVNDELSDEEQKRLAELQDKLYDLDTDYAVTIEKIKKKKSDAAKKDAEDAKKAADDAKKKRQDDYKNYIDSINKQFKALKTHNTLVINEVEENTQKRVDIESKAIDDEIAFQKKYQKELGLSNDDILVAEQEAVKKKKKLQEDYNKYIIDIQNRTTVAVDQMAIDSAKNAKDLTDAKIKQIQDNANIQLQNDKLTAEEKLKIEQDTAAAISKLKSDYITRDNNAAINSAIIAAEIEKKNLEDNNSFEYDAKIALQENLFNAKLADLENRKQLELSNVDLTEQEKQAIEDNYRQQRLQLEQENSDAVAKIKQDEVNNALAITDAGLNAAKGLSDAFFAGQMNKAKGNAAAELALKKKQFKVDKAFNIVRATIDGVRSVQAALTQTPPLSYVLAAFNGVLAAANIAKIASAKFDEGSASGGSVPTTPSAPSAVSTPQQSANFSAGQFYNLGQGGSSNQSKMNKVVVVETDITKTQKNVNKIETRATQSL